MQEDEILFAFSKNDLQAEAIHYIGRELKEEEYAKAKKLLEFGIGENIRQLYWGVFLEIINSNG